MIPFTLEQDIAKYTNTDDNFIGRSYLIQNKINKNWFPFFQNNQELLLNIFNNIDCNNIFPNYDHIFNAFTIDPNNIKIVLLGQDPYINNNQAHGYSFSVPNNEPLPPSLKNIFKEIDSEYPNKYSFVHGNLEKWSENGMFLLNSALTVQPGKSNSHCLIWKDFTDLVIQYISDNYQNIIFLLLGSFAKSKSKLIDTKKHIIIGGVHPSPLSAYNGFFNSGLFKKVDSCMNKLYGYPFDWQN